MIVIPESAAVAAIRILTKTNDLDVKLFKNNITPGSSTVVDDFVEADFIGYSAAQVSADDWSYTAGSPAVAEQQVEFVSTGGAQECPIYGYFVVERVSGDLRWCERFEDAPYTIHNLGDKIRIVLASTLRGES